MSATATASLISKILGPYMSQYYQDCVAGFLISFTLWNILNIIVFNIPLPDKNMSRNDYLDMRNRITSCIHGAIALFISGYNTYFVHSQCGEKNSEFESFILNFSNGYFAYDFVAMAYLGILDNSMIIHHSICIIGLSLGLYT